MRPIAFALAFVMLLAAPVGAADLTVSSGRLLAEITLDPWGLTLIDRELGAILVEDGAGGTGPSGSLGLRTETGWHHAVRARSARRRGSSVVAVLETDDPSGRTIEVTIEPAGSGIIAVEAGLVGGMDPEVSALGIGWETSTDERFFGFGEHSNAVDQRGNTVESWSAEGPFQVDEYPFVEVLVPAPGVRLRSDATYFPMPWLLSSHGYGVLIDNSEASYFRLASDDPSAWSLEVVGAPEGMGDWPAPERLRFRVFAGPTPADVLTRFTKRIGRQPEPSAPWVLGPWFQPGGSLEDLRAQVQTLRDADAPVSVAQTYTHYLPCGSHVNRRENERALTTAMHDAGVAVTTYFNPMICSDYQPRFDEAVAAGALAKNSAGEPYTYNYVASRTFNVGQFDFSARAGRRFYHSLLQEAVDDGYDGWMEDFGEYTPLDAVTADGLEGTATHNLHPLRYHCAAWDFVRRQSRPVVRFQRSGWTGVAPCAQVVWNGDPSTTWDFDGLASAVKNGLNLGLSGIGIWGSDIGGFHAFFDRALTDEMLFRWVQFGLVSGVMRTQRNGVALPEKERPQVEDPDQIDNWRRYAKLRTQLYPYIQAAALEYRRTGLPIMRHLILEAPTEEEAAGRDHDFMVGPDLLAAPVVTEGATTREVYLPTGLWIDFWRSIAFDEPTGGLSLGAVTFLEGAREVTIPAPIEELPLLVRAGALVALLSPDVDTLADYGEASPDLVRYVERRDVAHVMAFPRGSTQRRFGDRGRLRSRERPGRWTLQIRGGDARTFHIQASLAVLEDPLTPCEVEWRGKDLPVEAWTYDAGTDVLLVDVEGGRGRLMVHDCLR